MAGAGAVPRDSPVIGPGAECRSNEASLRAGLAGASATTRITASGAVPDGSTPSPVSVADGLVSGLVDASSAAPLRACGADPSDVGSAPPASAARFISIGAYAALPSLLGSYTAAGRSLLPGASCVSARRAIGPVPSDAPGGGTDKSARPVGSTPGVAAPVVEEGWPSMAPDADPPASWSAARCPLMGGADGASASGLTGPAGVVVCLATAVLGTVVGPSGSSGGRVTSPGRASFCRRNAVEASPVSAAA